MISGPGSNKQVASWNTNGAEDKWTLSPQHKQQGVGWSKPHLRDSFPPKTRENHHKAALPHFQCIFPETKPPQPLRRVFQQKPRNSSSRSIQACLSSGFVVLRLSKMCSHNLSPNWRFSARSIAIKQTANANSKRLLVATIGKIHQHRPQSTPKAPQTAPAPTPQAARPLVSRQSRNSLSLLQKKLEPLLLSAIWGINIDDCIESKLSVAPNTYKDDKHPTPPKTKQRP